MPLSTTSPFGFEQITVGLLFGLILFAIAVVDFREYRVPDQLNILALILRGIDLASNSDLVEYGISTLSRSLTLAAAFLFFRWTYRRLRGRDGLGLGDVKLAAVAGAWVHWSALPFVVEAAALVGLGLAISRSAMSGPALQRNMKVPFAVGFAPAIWFGWWLQRYFI
jgi:leader peptidase (prepilin peptidase)/N-methyltransferase